jgi:glycosyltransferase involved in cell wall biosynthesis
MADGPEIAVIVGAYSRSEYLLDAVRSVVGQTAPRGRWELLVTKNFRDESVEAELARVGATTIEDATPRIGTWLRRAIRATRAPIVTLLDDDDEYAPDRLARVLEVFRDHPEVGFYRNRVEIVDERGAAVPRSAWRPRGIDPYFDTSGPILVGTEAKRDPVDLLFRRTRVSFNSSSMAFRRELLDGRRGDWFDATRLPDSCLLLNAVLSPFDLYLDDRRLTRHRFHPANVTRGVGWLAWAAESHRGFAEEAREFRRPDLARYYDRAAARLEREWRSGEIVERVARGAPRGEVAAWAADYLRYLGRHPGERRLATDVWAAEAYALAYLVSPPLARRLRRARAGSGMPPGAGPSA